MNSRPNLKAAKAVEEYAEALAQETGGVTYLTDTQHALINQALEDLADLDHEAKLAGLPAPTSAAKEAALSFLYTAVRKAPRDYGVHLWHERTVVVYAQGATGYRISIYFEPDGNATCFVTRPNSKQNEYRYFSPAKEVACEWVFGVLRDLP